MISEKKKNTENLWAEIIDCIFKSYLKGKSLCYFSHSKKEEYPTIFHSMHNRKSFPSKKIKKIKTDEQKTLFQLWLMKDFSEEDEISVSGTDCTSQMSDEEF